MSSTTEKDKTDQKKELTIKSVSITPGSNIDGNYSLSCHFCSKQVTGNDEYFKISSRLSGKASFYCAFCLRNGFHQEKGKHVLKFSLRNIQNYLASKVKNKEAKDRESALKEIVWMADCAEFISANNPAFHYDRETLMWFIDFSKVGRGKNKIPVSYVKKTIMQILAAHNIFTSFDTQSNRLKSTTSVVRKIFEGIDKFHSTRYRPEGRPIMNVSPTNAAVVNAIDTE